MQADPPFNVQADDPDDNEPADDAHVNVPANNPNADYFESRWLRKCQFIIFVCASRLNPPETRFYIRMGLYVILGVALALLLRVYSHIDDKAAPEFYFLLKSQEVLNPTTAMFTFAVPTGLLLGFGIVGLCMKFHSGLDIIPKANVTVDILLFLSACIGFVLLILYPPRLFNDPNLNTDIRTNLLKTIHERSSDDIWKKVQNKYQCCGVDNGNDWWTDPLSTDDPFKCCRDTGECENSEDVIFTEYVTKCCYDGTGCLPYIVHSFYAFQDHYMWAMYRVCLAWVFALVLALLFAIIPDIPRGVEVAAVGNGNNDDAQGGIQNVENVALLEIQANPTNGNGRSNGNGSQILQPTNGQAAQADDNLLDNADEPNDCERPPTPRRSQRLSAARMVVF